MPNRLAVPPRAGLQCTLWRKNVRHHTDHLYACAAATGCAETGSSANNIRAGAARRNINGAFTSRNACADAEACQTRAIQTRQVTRCCTTDSHDHYIVTTENCYLLARRLRRLPYVSAGY